MKKVIAVLLLVVMLVSLTGCASWKRFTKSVGSDFSGGLNRTVTVYDYNGNPIKSWTGKFDLSESDQEVWFDLDGKRVVIQGGIVIVEEN